jgi:hypothetical protein
MVTLTFDANTDDVSYFARLVSQRVQEQCKTKQCLRAFFVSWNIDVFTIAVSHMSERTMPSYTPPRMHE